MQSTSIAQLPLRQLSWRIIGLAVLGSAALSAMLSLLFIGTHALLPALLIGGITPACCLLWLRAQVANLSQASHATNSAIEGYSRMDAITGLLNRVGFTEKALAAFMKARNEGALVSSVLIDVDHLKAINEEHGNAAGDAVLAHVATLLNMNIQANVDLAARYAGAEFVLVLPEADYAWATAFAERLRGTLANRPVPFDGKLIPVSASFGIASIMPADIDPEALIRRARKALRSAKTSGRNKVEVAEDQFPLAA